MTFEHEVQFDGIDNPDTPGYFAYVVSVINELLETKNEMNANLVIVSQTSLLDKCRKSGSN